MRGRIFPLAFLGAAFFFSSSLLAPVPCPAKNPFPSVPPSHRGAQGRARVGPEGASFSTAQVDTFLLAEYTFDYSQQCSDEGWVSVDLTAQADTFYHVDDYTPIEGAHSLWCGTFGDTCSVSGTYPGYGNLWNQYFESDWFPLDTLGSMHLYFTADYDCEQDYDYVYVEYKTLSGGTWDTLTTFTGTGYGTLDFPVATTVPGDSVKFRFHSVSDGGWSDEDGLYDSSGMIFIDSLWLRMELPARSAGVSSAQYFTVDYHDFEAEAVGARMTLDGDWRAYAAPGFGDFAGLFPGTTVLQEDGCTADITCLWGFFDGSSDTAYTCTGVHPEQPAVPKPAGGMAIWNEIRSPWIDIQAGVPPDADKTVVDFWVYADNPFSSFVYYYPRFRFMVGGCPTNWDDILVYHSPYCVWEQVVESLDTPAGATHFQVALGVIDMTFFYGGGIAADRSHAPLFDNVRVLRVRHVGPVWTVRDYGLFQDNFPADGTLTGKVACDLPEGRDSLVVTVSAKAGLAPDLTTGKAAVYAFVRSTGGQTGQALSGDVARFPFLGMDGDWSVFSFDTCYSGSGVPITDKYCFDLNDDFFTPPDRIDFYFGAKDAVGVWTYWSRNVGTTFNEAEVQADPCEMQCLPTGNSDILFVDDADGVAGDAVQRAFDEAFAAMGVAPDRFDVRRAYGDLKNSPGYLAQASQLVNVYRKIIWCSGFMSSTITEPDAQLLSAFLDSSSTWNPALYLTGNNVAGDMKSGGPLYLNLLNFISFDLTSFDHTSIGEPVSPLIVGCPGGIFHHWNDPSYPDTFIAEGDRCFGISGMGFNVLEPTGSATAQMAYSGACGDPTRSAVISQETTNAMSMTARVVLEGFSFDRIRDDRRLLNIDAAEHLMRILNWFENAVGVTSQRPLLVNSLAQNYPNPFNPTTTISFTLAERARVTVRIYDVAGRLVRTLVDEMRNPGVVHQVVWDGKGDRGEPAATGVYFYRMKTRGFQATRKMILLR